MNANKVITVDNSYAEIEIDVRPKFQKLSIRIDGDTTRSLDKDEVEQIMDKLHEAWRYYKSALRDDDPVAVRSTFGLLSIAVDGRDSPSIHVDCVPELLKQLNEALNYCGVEVEF